MKIFEIFFNKMQKNAWQIYWNRVLYTSTVRVSVIYGPVAQLVRAPACHAGGRRFEPVLGRQNALVAQLVEQQTENLPVGGSIPPQGTTKSGVLKGQHFL